jgi:hypothetical protein
MGKSHQKYEFGRRSRMASTNAGNIIVSATGRRGRSYVGKHRRRFWDKSKY